MIRHSLHEPGHRGAGGHLLQPLPRMVLIRYPDTAHQFCLADIQRRDPLDDLLVVLCPGEHLASSSPRGWPLPARAKAQLKQSDPRARSDTERPVKRLPAPGLETTSAIKQWPASAGSNQPRFSARNGHPGTGYQGLRSNPAAHAVAICDDPGQVRGRTHCYRPSYLVITSRALAARSPPRTRHGSRPRCSSQPAYRPWPIRPCLPPRRQPQRGQPRGTHVDRGLGGFLRDLVPVRMGVHAAHSGSAPCPP